MCVEKIKAWLRSLFEQKPQYKIAWEVRIFPGKQGAVREKPRADYLVDWLLAENESAVVRLVDGEDIPLGILHDGSMFYYIAVGKKRGWLLYKESRMTLVPKQVPV